MHKNSLFSPVNTGFWRIYIRHTYKVTCPIQPGGMFGTN